MKFLIEEIDELKSSPRHRKKNHHLVKEKQAKHEGKERFALGLFNANQRIREAGDQAVADDDVEWER